MGLFGFPNVEKLKNKGNVEGLIKALSYEKDIFVRREAAYALGAVEPLCAALNDSDGNVRARAAEALVKIGKPSVEPLCAALKNNSNGNVRAGAAEALGKIGDVRTVGPLYAALKDSDKGVRTGAAEALVKIGKP
jgi:HEAT repeat protein